jgi:hypothetical protein
LPLSIQEQHDALVRPQAESARRVETLRQTTADAERTLAEIDYLFNAVQEGLSRKFESEREDFLRNAVPNAKTELDSRIDADVKTKDLANRAMEAAQVIARQAVIDWRGRMAPSSGSSERSADAPSPR